MKVEKVLFILLSMALIFCGIAFVIMNTNIKALEENNQTHQEAIEHLNEEVVALQPTQMQRYFYSLIDEVVLGGEVQFVELGKAYDDEIEEWGYKNYVVELEETTMVQITIEFENTFLEGYDNSVHMHVYYDGIMDADITYENLEKTVSYTIALQKGFNTIELDSYSDNSWEYTITITRKDQGDT